jgi:hypothetical protein
VVVGLWSPPAGGTMLDMSQAVANGKTVEYEFIVLREEANGDVRYVAKPSRRAETAFKFVNLTERDAVFENPAHDFPQRIIYAIEADGTLPAAIDGTKDGQMRRVELGIGGRPLEPRMHV